MRQNDETKRPDRSGALSCSVVDAQLHAYSRLPIPTKAEALQLGRLIQAWQVRRAEFKTAEDEAESEQNDSSYRKLARAGKRARDRLIAGNMRLAITVAKKYQGRGLPLEDLIQEGALGLQRAAEKFDPTRGYTFSTYAFWWIRQAVTISLYHQGQMIRVPPGTADELAKLRRFLSNQQGSKPVSTARILDHMGFQDEKELDKLYAAWRVRDCYSLSSTVGNNDDLRLEDVLACPLETQQARFEMLEALHRRERLDRLIQNIDAQHAEAFRLRLDGLKIAEIATVMRVPVSRANTYVKSAIQMLTQMAEREDAGLPAIVQDVAGLPTGSEAIIQCSFDFGL